MSATKKKVSSEIDISNLKRKSCFKIFDTLIVEHGKYYLDKEYCVILDKDKNIVGVSDNDEHIFFNILQKIIYIP